jgi:hypothetical protein
MHPDISKMLTLSTRHVPLKELPAVARAAFADNAYCWLLYVGDPDTDDAPALANLVALAKSRGCSWLRLDQDGPVEPELPSWDW